MPAGGPPPANTPVSIRPAEAGDAASVASLLSELGYPATPAAVLRRLEDRRDASDSADFVADLDTEVAGFLSAGLLFYFPEDIWLCRVTALVVARRHRGKGAGKALLEAASEFARSRGCKGVEITAAEGRAAAHRFYERMGYARTSYRFFRALCR